MTQAVKQQKQIKYPPVSLSDVLKEFWQAVKPQKWILFLLVFCIIVANIIAATVPLFYKAFFDILTSNQSHDAVVMQLYQVLIYLALFHMAWWLFARTAEFANNVYQPKTMAALKQRSYNYLIEHSYSFFANNFVGSLVQKVNRFGRAFERLSDNLIWALLPLVVRVSAILVVLFFINYWIDLIVLIWIVLFVGINIIFSRWKIKYDIKAAAMDSKTTAYLADTVTNQNTISLFSSFAFEKKGYKSVTKDQSSLTIFSWHLDAVIHAIQAALSLGIEIVLFYFAIKYWDQGLVTISVFALLQVYAASLIDQLWGFTRIVRDMYQSYADAKEMVEIIKLPHEIKDVAGAETLTVKKGEIEFNNLGFNFNEKRQVLNDISLTIKSGEKVALVGSSGAGKTTFVRLLLRLYDATSGKILVDGQDIAKVTQNSLRDAIAMVPQDPVLFHRTLAENIAYGKKDATRNEIVQAAKLAHCDEFINNLPQGLDTFVGERGIKLSGGERQRVAIARAILKNAPILILDEATSSLDSHSESLIQDALNNLMQGRTTIVIAHRLSTIQKMDRIIVVDQGKILEQGSHQDLLAKEDSLYKKLWTLQAGGFLEEEEEEEQEIDSEDVLGEEDYQEAESVSF